MRHEDGFSKDRVDSPMTGEEARDSLVAWLREAASGVSTQCRGPRYGFCRSHRGGEAGRDDVVIDLT